MSMLATEVSGRPAFLLGAPGRKRPTHGGCRHADGIGASSIGADNNERVIRVVRGADRAAAKRGITHVVVPGPGKTTYRNFLARVQRDPITLEFPDLRWIVSRAGSDGGIDIFRR